MSVGVLGLPVTEGLLSSGCTKTPYVIVFIHGAGFKTDIQIIQS